MMQKMDFGTSEIFEEFSSYVHPSEMNDTHKACGSGKPSVEEQSNIPKRNIEKYQFILAEYGSGNNEVSNNCESQFHAFDTQIYPVHMQDTQNQMCSSNMSECIQEPAHDTNACETETSSTPKLMPLTDLQEGESKKTDAISSKDVQYLKEMISCDVEEVDHLIESEILENETEISKPGSRKFYVELNEQTIFALHGLDASLPVTCDLCQLHFDTMSKFDDHMRQHLETRFFMCQLCSKTYVSWQNLVAHRKVCHYGQFISCNGCAHRKHHHNLGPVSFPVDNFPVGCEECHKGFRNANELNRHYRCHAPDKCGNLDLEKMGKEKYRQLTGMNEAPNEVFGVTNDNYNSCCKRKDRRDLPRTTYVTNTSKCNLCEEEMHSFKKLITHKKLHFESNITYRCPFCKKIFKDKAKYKNHKLTHIAGEQYQCKECFKKFNSKSSLAAHEYAHPATEMYRCFNCQMEFNVSDDLVHHITKVHYQCPDIKLICDICTTNHLVYKFMDHYLLCHDKKRLQKTAEEEANVTCEVCSKVLPNFKALYHHVKTHNSIKQPYLCEVCGKIIQQADSFITHIHSHRKDYDENISEINMTVMDNSENIKNSKYFVCEYCGREFKNRISLQLHIQRHTGEKPYKCTWCPMTFYTRQQLSVHQRHHTWKSSYNCTVCKKSFPSSTLLCTHKCLHSSTKQYTCLLCKRNFLRLSAYRNHMQAHSRVHPYKCDKCSKTFLIKNKMVLHKRTHEKGKLNSSNHMCSDCGQNFTSAQELENHHEEKCYLTMITFMSSGSDENKESSPQFFLNTKNNTTIC